MLLTSLNPATEEIVESFNEMSKDEVAELLDEVAKAAAEWKATSFTERTELMHKVASLLRDRKEQYGTLMAEEMGKPILQGIAEAEKCAWVCEYYAENAEPFLRSEQIPTSATDSFIRFDPLGVVLAVMPWNFPFWQVFRFAAPGLMAGNGAVLKHASNVPRCALAIESIFREAGFPEHLFRTALIGHASVAHLIADPRIAAVTLTGSEIAGRSVAEKAGKAIKKTVLELGGSDPFIVLPDCDLQKCVNNAVTARLINSGQSCIAAKRFIVCESIAQDFIHAFCAAMEAAKVGDPMANDTQVGPLARVDLRELLHSQVERSIEQGAKVECGGTFVGNRGYYYAPTVLTDITVSMAVWNEETFGPVAPVMVVADEREAIQKANRSDLGLGASLWTEDVERARHLAAQIEAGAVFINTFVKSDPRLPFGGIKQSGYGRELSQFGIREFVNIKTVWIE